MKPADQDPFASCILSITEVILRQITEVILRQLDGIFTLHGVWLCSFSHSPIPSPAVLLQAMSGLLQALSVKFHEKLSVHILVFKTGHKVSMEAVLLSEFVGCVEVCTETNLLS